jgi:hypothetical protein
MSDYIESLPTDETTLNKNDEILMKNILKNDKSTLQKFITDLKLPMIMGGLFLILSAPQTSDFIKHIVPYAKSSETSLLTFKTFILMIVVFFYNNCNLIMLKTE